MNKIHFITDKDLIDKLKNVGYPMEDCRHYYGKETRIKSDCNLTKFPPILSEVKEEIFKIYLKDNKYENVEPLYDVPDIHSVCSWIVNRKKIFIDFKQNDNNKIRKYIIRYITDKLITIESDYIFKTLEETIHGAIKYVLENNLITNDMQKIMFNDKYHLTEFVLNGTKTMTRRFIHNKFNLYDNVKLDGDKLTYYNDDKIIGSSFTHYKIGEVVAIAQAYNNIPVNYGLCHDDDSIVYLKYPGSDEIKYGSAQGVHNKMFVSAANMPHHIQITGIKVEQIQDISHEDVVKEGIIKTKDDRYYLQDCLTTPNYLDAYKFLIEKLGGKKDWENNSFVIVYEFKLVD